MRACKKEGCENIVPKYYVDDTGKKHHLQRRKFCFECSPYGKHNTKNLNRKEIGYGSGTCPVCNGVSQSGKKKCFSCYFSDRKNVISKRVYGIVGYKCWYCDYDKGSDGQGVLEFHHIFSSDKLFNISTREFVGRTWKKVIKEIKKCASLCCRCHREYHVGIIPEEEIINIYKYEWEKINNNEDKIKLIKNKKQGRFCPNCKNEFFKNTKYCSIKCSGFGKRKVINRPSKKQLLQEIEETNYCAVGRKYGVSDKCIRKWID